MPCNDISEAISLHFDGAERLESYRLTKRTCGAAIGDAALLLPLVAGRPLNELRELCAQHLPTDLPARLGRPVVDSEAFLFHKHWLALREALAVLTGEASGAPGDVCTADSIVADSDGLRFEGLISIAAVTAKIKACGNCGRCRL